MSPSLAVRPVRPCFVAVALATLAALPAWSAATVPTEVQQPGTQPAEVAAFVGPDNCKNCHANTANPELEPYTGWQGSMMAHAARDPLFWATLAVVEQDFLPGDPATRGGAGDLCLRCHMPGGWLGERSVPTDGSAMSAATDTNGVECEFCHKLVNPDPAVNVAGTIERQTAPFLAHDETTGEPYHGTAQYVINAGGARLGPYANPAPGHPSAASAFHRQSELCGTCHDVSNPAVGDLAHNHGALLPLPPGSFSGVLGAPVDDKAAFNNPPYAYGAVERTYSEWKASAFPTARVNDFPSLPPDLQAAGGALEVAYQRAWAARSDADYEDGTPRYYTCQTCHMSASTGVGCNMPAAPTRTDLPRHDLTGAGYWVPDLILYQEDAGTLRFGTGLSQEQRDQLEAGKLRATEMLRSAASLSAVQAGGDLEVRVTNLTGHKLITGYPEGRRMWLNVRWFDAEDALIEEHGAYGPIGRTVEDADGTVHAVHSLIDLAGTRAYETHPGMDQEWASQLLGFGYAPGFVLGYDRMTDAVVHTLGQLAAETPGTAYETFHFVLNNVVTSDTRIPPYRMDYDTALERVALPIPTTQYGNPGAGGVYDHFDDASLAIPLGAVRAEVRLYYQQTSWEYVQFLWLQNDGQSAFLGAEGANLLDAWLNTGMSPPLEMELLTVDLFAFPGPPGEASHASPAAEQMRAAWNSGTGRVEIEYTVACDATEHNVYYGDLGSVSTHTYAGAECLVGTGGSASFDPGLDDAFFLVVGNNGSVEGSYGRDSAGAERPEHVGTPSCDFAQDLGSTCDP